MVFENNNLSEANIQAECYYRLRLLKIPCCLEYIIKNPKTKNKYYRLDIAILKKVNKQFHIIAIVEIKNRTYPENGINKNTRQYRRYSSLGLPLIYCLNSIQIDKTIKKIRKVYDNYIPSLYTPSFILPQNLK